jgi:hypothetical protein
MARQEASMILDIFALIVIGILIGFVIWLVVKLGPLPGNIAANRGHPQADAIRVLGWIGVITLGLAWPIALIWAYTRTGEQQSEHLSQRVADLESELAVLKATGGDT